MKAARRGRGLTQAEVARILKVSQSAVSKFESGILVPSASTWFDFCLLTGIDPRCFQVALEAKNARL